MMVARVGTETTLLLALVMLGLCGASWGSFDWGTPCTAGSGTLPRVAIRNYGQWPQYTVTDIGEIPAGLGPVYIEVDAGSTRDIDVEVRDKLTGEKIVGSGLDQDASLPLGGERSVGKGGTASYRGVTYRYSGYDGVGYAGKETFEVLGDTNRVLVVSAVTDGRDALDIGGTGAYVRVTYRREACGGFGGDYRETIATRAEFEGIAARSSVPGAIGIFEVKFVVMGVDTASPRVYFMNTQRYSYHYDFVSQVLREYDNVARFNDDTYFFDARKNIAGTMLAHDSFVSAETGRKGLYTVEFWPTDPVSAALTTRTYELIRERFGEAAGRLAHFPASATQERIYEENKGTFAERGVAVVLADELFAHVTFSPLNLGVGYGTLRVIETGSETFSVRDVVIFKAIPNDLSHVGGIITDAPQTPLSHINLKAKQNKMPNAFVKDASSDAAIGALLGKVVRYEVRVDGYELREATQAEADAWLESVRPKQGQKPQADLGATAPARLTAIGHADWVRYGAKAANVAELAKVLERGQVPDGYAVPFSVYDEYMRAKRCEGTTVDPETGAETRDGRFRKLCTETRTEQAVTAGRRAMSTAPAVVLVGGAYSEVRVELAAGADLDLVLTDASGAYVVYSMSSSAALSDAGTTTHDGATVAYGGYAGGNEWITVTGTTTGELRVSVYGYEAGSGTVTVRGLPAGAKSYYDQIREVMGGASFQSDPAARDAALKAFRTEVKKGEVPAAISAKLNAVHEFWRNADGTMTRSVRLRSSTNNEDLEGFNGAGLYESTTHDPDEGELAESAKKVWAGLWTFRAFEERDFYRIDHFQTYMGVLAHESYGDEQANGVGVTKNIYSQNTRGHYVNVQYGEISVTNPEPIQVQGKTVSSIPDEFLLARVVGETGFEYTWIQQYIRRSNVETVYGKPVPTPNVLTDSEVDELRVAMDKIQAHFKSVYNGGDSFAMDIEFKITYTADGSRGHLEVKQARPWID